MLSPLAKTMFDIVSKAVNAMSVDDYYDKKCDPKQFVYNDEVIYGFHMTHAVVRNAAMKALEDAGYKLVLRKMLKPWNTNYEHLDYGIDVVPFIGRARNGQITIFFDTRQEFEKSLIEDASRRKQDSITKSLQERVFATLEANGFTQQEIRRVHVG